VIGGEGAAGKRATAALSAVAGGDEIAGKKGTSRIQMPQTVVPAPVTVDVPKTIKVRAASGTQPVSMSQTSLLSALPDIETSDAAAPAGDSAAPAPATAGATTGTGDAPAGPKTIKLKRPGEMTTIKVSVAGMGGARPAPLPPPAAADQGTAAAATAGDTTSPTQKKTIRVKRPAAPAAAPGTEGLKGEPGVTTMAAMAPAPVQFSPMVVPERNTGWFVAVAVLCLLLAIGVVAICGVELFGKPPNTELDSAYQKG
jgi:hypothetical protein